MKRLTTMTENKLLVLFALKTLGAVDEQQLWRFIVQCDLMEYIEFSLCRAELDEAGMLRTLADDQGQRLQGGRRRLYRSPPPDGGRAYAHGFAPERPHSRPGAGLL